MRRHALLALVVATAGSCSFSIGAPTGADATPNECTFANWLDPTWTARLPLAIQHAAVRGAPGEMPVLVAITSTVLVSSSLTAANIVFTAGDGVTPLPSEIEAFDPATGSLVAWVRVPGINSATDVPFFVYFANASPPAPTIEDVWPEFLAVWHFRDAPEGIGSVRDSTPHGFDLTSEGMTASDRVAGIIGPAYQFDGLDDELSRSPWSLPNPFTLEVMFRPRQLGGFKTILDNAANSRFVGLIGDDVEFYDGTAYAYNTTVTINQWHHLAASYDGSKVRVYYDGDLVGTTPSINLQTSNHAFLVGNSPYDDRFDGLLDEVRIASGARSTDVIATSYANMIAAESFVTYGPIDHCR